AHGHRAGCRGDRAPRHEDRRGNLRLYQWQCDARNHRAGRVSWSIRRLTRHDFDAYLAIRLEALRNHPESYGTSPESFAARPREEIENFLSVRALFGVVTAAGELAGIVLYDRDSGERESHRGWMLQVYVQPALRGTGAA